VVPYQILPYLVYSLLPETRSSLFTQKPKHLSKKAIVISIDKQGKPFDIDSG
jgi:hypothetical protein